ncbi:hypothetical protein [Pseudomonas maioricensis]|uniref:hypothetical protein n=1 Tax=Pseudomonas maioricensis TaxID=1766623 RepID=UPI001FADDA00|nr:hypothetical protein [Pseudomonas sp. S25]
MDIAISWPGSQVFSGELENACNYCVVATLAQRLSGIETGLEASQSTRSGHVSGDMAQYRSAGLSEKHTIIVWAGCFGVAETLAPVIHRLFHRKCAQAQNIDISRYSLVATGDNGS